jgi:cell division protein ZapE
MSEFHKLMLQSPDKKPQRRESIIDMLAKEVVRKSKVICLDELQINNIADAMVIYQLVAELLKHSAFIFLTSNFMPEDLFKDGLQRERFLPFIELVRSRLNVYHLNSQSDYRLDKLLAEQKCYYWPQELEMLEPCYETVIEIDHNRRISVAKSYENTALFSFKDLCASCFGALDYLAICRRFDVLILTHLRAMELEDHNELLRFITLIDCIYENKVKLICFAAVPIDALYSGARYEVEFRRTVSRLHEMQSAQYDASCKKSSRAYDLFAVSASA